MAGRKSAVEPGALGELGARRAGQHPQPRPKHLVRCTACAWTATRTPNGRSIEVTGTANATAGSRGTANTGLRGRVDGDLTVRDTGGAKATGGGQANTGIQPD